MKVSCPKCHIRCVVADELIPEGGAWAKCPKCQERFFINPKALNLLTEGFPGEARPSLSKGRDTQKFIQKIRKKRGIEDAPDGFDSSKMVALSIYSPPNYRLYVGVSIFLLLICAIWVINLFLQTSGPKEPLAQARPLTSALYDHENLRNDLITLRKRSAALHRVSWRIEASGAETRIFNYMMDALAHGVCPDISELEIKSDQPSESIEMQARCEGYGSDLLSPVIMIIWNGRSVTARISDRREGMEIELFP